MRHLIPSTLKSFMYLLKVFSPAEVILHPNLLISTENPCGHTTSAYILICRIALSLCFPDQLKHYYYHFMYIMECCSFLKSHNRITILAQLKKVQGQFVFPSMLVHLVRPPHSAREEGRTTYLLTVLSALSCAPFKQHCGYSDI